MKNNGKKKNCQNIPETTTQPPNKKRCKYKTATAILSAGVLIASAFDVRLKVQHYYLGSSKLSSNIRIALLTDLHSCSYGKGQKTLLKAIHTEKPDVVLLGGDIFDEDLPFLNGEEVIADLSQHYPCYYVTGNHEYWGEDLGLVLRTISSYGVTILSGEHDTIEINGNIINICGITDPDIALVPGDHPSTLGQLENLKEVANDENYSILLAHRPENIDFYLDYDYDLMLSGHAHGGQWRIPGLVNGVFAPNQGFFPKYAGGEYTFGEQTFIVSRGLARETTIVPRIFNRPELVIIDVV